MQRLPAGEMLHLVPAGCSRRDQGVTWLQSPCRRQKLSFSNEPRNLVMLAGIAERTGHAAAAGIQIHHFRSWNPPQQVAGWREQSHGLLVTMSVQQNVRRPGLQVQV